MDYYNYIKSLHLIFVITWFAGLFYIPRIFIYHIEASQKNISRQRNFRTAQLKLMAKRLMVSLLHGLLQFWLFCLVYGF